VAESPAYKKGLAICWCVHERDGRLPESKRPTVEIGIAAKQMKTSVTNLRKLDKFDYATLHLTNAAYTCQPT
jgi:hypothetical protein